MHIDIGKELVRHFYFFIVLVLEDFLGELRLYSSDRAQSSVRLCFADVERRGLVSELAASI